MRIDQSHRPGCHLGHLSRRLLQSHTARTRFLQPRLVRTGALFPGLIFGIPGLCSDAFANIRRAEETSAFWRIRACRVLRMRGHLWLGVLTSCSPCFTPALPRAVH